MPKIDKYKAKVGGILMLINTVLSGAFCLESFTSTELLSETSEVSKMELFAKIINS